MGVIYRLEKNEAGFNCILNIKKNLILSTQHITFAIQVSWGLFKQGSGVSRGAQDYKMRAVNSDNKRKAKFRRKKNAE